MILKLGDNGPEVGVWQKYLQTQGFSSVAIDNDFGPATEDATKRFQTSCVLTVDGIVGDGTIAQAMHRGFAGFDIELVIDTKPIHTPAESHLALFPGTRIEQINAAMLSKVAPVIQAKGKAFIDIASQAGTVLQIVQGLRTFSEQDALYAQGRSTPGKRVTNARGGQSLHNYGLAIDCASVVNGAVNWDDSRFAVYGGWARTAGLEWGGGWRTFKDLPHVQYTAGKKLGEIQNIFRAGGLAAVWNAVR